MLEKLAEIICNYVEVEPEAVKPESRFMEDLGFTSFDFMSMLGELEDRFDVEVEERAAAAACSSDYLDRYKNIQGQVPGTDKKGIVDAVIAEMQDREKERTEAEKQEILGDLDDFGI